MSNNNIPNNLNVYTSGQLVEMAGQFVNLAGQPADPTTITLKYRAQGGSTQTLVYGSSAIVRDGVGAYHFNYDSTGYTNQEANQLVTQQWIGTGNVQAINPGYFEVEAPPL